VLTLIILTVVRRFEPEPSGRNPVERAPDKAAGPGQEGGD
jgi:hypothetical protein